MSVQRKTQGQRQPVSVARTTQVGPIGNAAVQRQPLITMADIQRLKATAERRAVVVTGRDPAPATPDQARAARHKLEDQSDVCDNCQHSEDQHEDGDGRCLVPGCDCQAFEEEGEEARLGGDDPPPSSKPTPGQPSKMPPADPDKKAVVAAVVQRTSLTPAQARAAYDAQRFTASAPHRTLTAREHREQRAIELGVDPSHYEAAHRALFPRDE